ncbi:MAG: hypothetical protein AUJ97_09185 [Bacteroidetes bacterium CG2_30_32_10]|nr:MAG: hypothetical protein AUJ97_09185 [Bacteroidetes bacterium CG2_30_32_10]
MKKSLFLLSIFLIVLSMFAEAQTRKLRKDEFVFGMGGTGFMGELGGANTIGSNEPKDFDFKAVRPSFDFGYRLRISDCWAIKTSIFYGMVYGSDQLTKEKFRNNRNLSFRSHLGELSSQLEFFFMSNQEGHRYKLKTHGYRNIRISPYMFAGIGGFYYNPQAKYFENANGTSSWVNLKDYHTEGQGILPTRKKYSNFAFCIPFGVGVTYGWTKYWSIGLEYGFRKTFTDYIDDCSTTYVDPKIYGNVDNSDIHTFMSTKLANPSPTKGDIDSPFYISTQPGMQRGDPKKKDAYMFAMINIFYKIHNNKNFFPLFQKKRKY